MFEQFQCHVFEDSHEFGGAPVPEKTGSREKKTKSETPCTEGRGSSQLFKVALSAEWLPRRCPWGPGGVREQGEEGQGRWVGVLAWELSCKPPGSWREEALAGPRLATPGR